MVDNQLTNLDVSKNIELISLSCSNNQLTGIDVSKNIVLKELFCDNNQLTNLDVSNNIALKWLDCSNNQLSATALNALFKTLHDNDSKVGKILLIGNNPGTAYCNKKIATDKGWIVKKAD